MDIQKKRLFSPVAGVLAAFACQFLLFQLTEFLVNDRAAALLGVDMVNVVYSAGLFSTASGYLLFALLSRRIGSVAGRRLLLVCMGAAYLLSGICMARTMQPLTFVACALVALLSAGYLGGMVHLILASALRDGRYIGRATSAAIAAGIGLQYLVQNLLPVRGAAALLRGEHPAGRVPCRPEGAGLSAAGYRLCGADLGVCLCLFEPAGYLLDQRLPAVYLFRLLCGVFYSDVPGCCAKKRLPGVVGGDGTDYPVLYAGHCHSAVHLAF